ncbi:7953_t:CDS:10 [Ambispora leptoticha]|uniref:7953_t:CDS:1 n=1 Tax=Ambispora leptoticha TaxID=144679 RepID=A0A9N8Z4U6_9GLOM|nr:7953_t:CDS:10 [Ambispora leptoticha]
MSIIPWPVFNDSSFYTTIKNLKIKLDGQNSQYKNAKIFVEKIKVLMTKLKVCDWGSVQGTVISIRTLELKKFMKNAISLGLEQKEDDTFLSSENITQPVYIIRHLMNRDEGTPIPDPELSLSDIFDDVDASIKLMPDTDLRDFFEVNVQARDQSSDSQWFDRLETFYKFIIDRRVNRLQQWFFQNTSRFPNDHNEICIKFAGHEGYHACSASHSCGAPCTYNGKRNCQLRCTKEIGHETMPGNEVHLCEATRHYCSAPCSLKADTQKGHYECRNYCIIPCEEIHVLHKCGNDVCPVECAIAACRQRCESRAHFHAFEKNVEHFCGGEHQCPNECEESGICKIVTEPTAIIKEEAEYVNKFGSFMFTKYFQTFQRLPCCIKIPPYQFKHEGKHVHERTHECDATCPNDSGEHIENKKSNFHFCDCTLPYNHGREHNSEHDTVHGNMHLTTFTCEQEEFEFEGHQLTVGDRGDFVLCHKLCQNIGRHRHIDYCKEPDVCESLTGGKKEGILEHIKANINPDPNRKKDYISHRVFWERTKFRDPYSREDRENFKKCDHECIDEKHHKAIDEKEPIKSFCTQGLFHPGLNPNSHPPQSIGYISTDGHHFTCENPIGNFHIVFVVDRSSSMSSRDRKPLNQRTITSCLLNAHNNRLGAVYEAVYNFIKTRNHSGKATFVGRAAVDRDITSLILFNNAATVVFENQNLSDTEELLNMMMKFTPAGGTFFREGIKKAAEIIEKYYDPKKTNVIMFLSDGECDTPELTLRNLCQREVNKGTPLYLYTVLFNNHAKFGESLKKMADIATEYLPQPTSKDLLKCQYTLAVNEIELNEHFTRIAESLRKHQPMLM